MFAIIDGTGAYNDQEYNMNMARSFCWQLNTGIPGSRYYRGPGADGLNCDQIANKVTIDVRTANEPQNYLAGYSRGGAIAIQVAKLLNEAPTVTFGRYPKKAHLVHGLFLFDPVGYTHTIDFNTIPPNVRRCYVILRDRSIKKQDFFLPKWETLDWRDFLIGCIAKDEDRYAREWMGNCKTNAENPQTTLVEHGPIQDCSHGAAGGVPWVERPADKKATEDAAAWMNAALRKHGFKVELKQRWFTRNSARDYPQSVPIDYSPKTNWRQPSQNWKRPGEM